MAGIDKMHMTDKQLETFVDWLQSHYNIGYAGQEIIDQLQYQDNFEGGRFNFSERTDKYLMKHCKLKFVQKRLKEQY